MKAKYQQMYFILRDMNQQVNGGKIL